jgi:hypothetical protein
MPSKSFDSEPKNLNKNWSQTKIENEQKEHPHANNSNCRDVRIIDFLNPVEDRITSLV